MMLTTTTNNTDLYTIIYFNRYIMQLKYKTVPLYELRTGGNNQNYLLGMVYSFFFKKMAPNIPLHTKVIRKQKTSVNNVLIDAFFVIRYIQLFTKLNN